MDEEAIKYFEEADEMFATAGWKNLVDELTREVYQLQADALEATSWDVVVRLQGLAEAYNRLIRLEEIADVTRAQALAEAAEDDANI